jgi:hypothetical protein
LLPAAPRDHHEFQEKFVPRRRANRRGLFEPGAKMLTSLLGDPIHLLHASLGTVTHIPPDQPFWIDQETAGGWHVAGAELKDMLIEIGLPQTPPNAEERPMGQKGATNAPSVTYIAIAILFIFSALVTGWRLRRAIVPAS